MILVCQDLATLSHVSSLVGINGSGSKFTSKCRGVYYFDFAKSSVLRISNIVVILIICSCTPDRLRCLGFIIIIICGAICQSCIVFMPFYVWGVSCSGIVVKGRWDAVG